MRLRFNNEISLGHLIQVGTFVVAVVVWFARVEAAIDQIREVQKNHAEAIKNLSEVAVAQSKQIVRLETLIEHDRRAAAPSGKPGM
jgi:CHASE3 domain sensor protein